MGVRPGRWSPGSCRPASKRRCSPSPSPGSAPSRHPSSRSTGTARSGSRCASRRPSFFAVPGTWRGFDHTAMAHRLAAELDRPPLIFEAYDQLPDADPAVLPAPPTDGTAVRWIYWTSGTTSDPKGVLHTDRTPDRGRLVPGPRAAPVGRRHRLDGVPVRPYRRAGLHRDAAALRLPGGPLRAVRHARRAGRLPAPRSDGRGRLDRVLLDVPDRTAQGPRRPGWSPPCGCWRAAGRRSRRRSTTRSYGRWASSSPTATA